MNGARTQDETGVQRGLAEELVDQKQSDNQDRTCTIDALDDNRYLTQVVESM